MFGGHEIIFNSPKAETDLKAIAEYEAKIIFDVEELLQNNGCNVNFQKQDVDDRTPDTYGMGTHFKFFMGDNHFMNGIVFAGLEEDKPTQHVAFYPIDTVFFLNDYEFHFLQNIQHYIHIPEYNAQNEILNLINDQLNDLFETGQLNNLSVYNRLDFSCSVNPDTYEASQGHENEAQKINFYHKRVLDFQDVIKESDVDFQPDLIKQNHEVFWDMTLPNQDKIQEDFIQAMQLITLKFKEIATEYQAMRLTGSLCYHF